MTVRERIQSVLDRNPDMSMRRVSLAAGSDSLISKVLNPEKRGGIKSLTIDKTEAVARALGVSPAWLAFGDEGVTLSEDVLLDMVDQAVSEIQPGMKIGEIRKAVAAALHEQLRLHQVVGGVQDISAGASVPGTAVQSPAPTSGAGRAGSRNA